MTVKRVLDSAVVATGLAIGCAAISPAAAAEALANNGRLWVYIGTYTTKTSKGIYLCQLDVPTGKLDLIGVAAETARPSFVTIHPNQRFLYAVGEVADFQGKKSGVVNAFSINPDGKLSLLNQQPSQGMGPCYVNVDRTGKFAFVANYGSGAIACFPIQNDGCLGEATSAIQHEGSSVNPKRQQGPHAHSIYVDPTNRFVFTADLGMDKVMVYRFDAATGRLTPNDPPFAKVTPGDGPRHIAFHPNGRFVYVINEMGQTVTAFNYNSERGALETFQEISTVPEGFQGPSTTAEVQVHPSGKFLYGSNRGHDSIAIFSIDQNTGRLTALGHQPSGGKTPRNFGIDPSGSWLLAAHQDSDDIFVFRIDPQTGLLKPTGQSINISMPVCVKMMPAR
jgi:6-phosphogluconolactonase